jgi:hypothetical protein
MTLPTPKTAIYNCTLPVSKKKVKFRPWTNGEEKTLLIGKDDIDKETIRDTLFNVLNACTFDKIKAEDLADIDVDWLMFAIRSKAVGEIATLIARCINFDVCKNDVEFDIDIDKDVSVVGNLDNLKNNKIQVDADIWFEMSLPKRSDMDAFMADTATTEEMIARCIKSIYTSTDSFSPSDYTPEELTTWIDSFTDVSLKKVRDFLKDIPKVVVTHTSTCKCGTSNTLRLEGFSDFFL